MQQTSDLSIFDLKKGNRDILPQLVKSLTESIRKHNQLYLKPIIINQKMEILDGQHRYLAAKALEVDLYYIQTKGKENDNNLSMMSLNSVQEKWKMADFLNFWVKEENSNYILFKDLMTKYNFPFHTCLSWVSGYSKTQLKTFKDGEFKFDDSIHLLECIKQGYEIIDIMNLRKLEAAWLLKSNRFTSALKKILFSGLVDSNSLMQALKKNSYNFHLCGTAREYACQLLDIYNFKKQSRILLISDRKRFKIVQG